MELSAANSAASETSSKLTFWLLLYPFPFFLKRWFAWETPEDLDFEEVLFGGMLAGDGILGGIAMFYIFPRS